MVLDQPLMLAHYPRHKVNDRSREDNGYFPRHKAGDFQILELFELLIKNYCRIIVEIIKIYRMKHLAEDSNKQTNCNNQTVPLLECWRKGRVSFTQEIYLLEEKLYFCETNGLA